MALACAAALGPAACDGGPRPAADAVPEPGVAAVAARGPELPPSSLPAPPPGGAGSAAPAIAGPGGPASGAADAPRDLPLQAPSGPTPLPPPATAAASGSAAGAPPVPPAPTAPSPPPATAPDVPAPRGAAAAPPPERTARRPLAPGQWTRHRVREASGRTGVIEHRVVGVEGGAHWVESERDGLVVKVLLAAGASPTDVEVRAAVLRAPGGQVVRMEGADLDGVRALLGRLTAGWSAGAGDWAGQPREDVTVAAGAFPGAFRGPHAVSGGPVRASGIAWHHPAVPISGLVRSRDDDGGGMDLVAWGETGAISKLP